MASFADRLRSRQRSVRPLLGIEPLEDRRLLSGSISGTVTDETVYSYTGATHGPVAGVQVFIDLQNKDALASDDPVATTDAAGHYTFGSLPAGHYTIRLVPTADRLTSAPAIGGSYAFDLAADQNVAGDDFGLSNYTTSTTQTDGKILASRPEDVARSVLLWRVNPDGSLDAGFGSAGVATVAPAEGFFGSTTPTQIVVRSDGTILVLYTTASDGSNSLLTAFTADGRNKTTHNLAEGGLGSLPAVGRIALLPDGKTIGAGDLPDAVNGEIHDELLLTRFNRDFTPDGTFGTNGQIQVADIRGVLDGIEALPDGRIRVSYSDHTFSLSAISGRVMDETVYSTAGATHPSATHAPVAGVRVYLDLQNSDTFAPADPVATTDAAGDYTFSGLAAGHYVVRLAPTPGLFTSTPAVGGSYAVDLAADQSITGEDFGITAYTTSAVQSDGKTLASRPEGDVVPIVPVPLLLWRINPDGSLDNTFGNGGAVALVPAVIYGNYVPQQILPASDGSSLVLSTTYADGDHSDLTAIRADGSISRSALIEGVAIVVARADDGRLLIAGGEGVLNVNRLNSDLTADNSFGDGGRVQLDTVLGIPSGITGSSDGRVRVYYYDKTVTLTAAGALERLVLFKHPRVRTHLIISASVSRGAAGTPFTLSARVAATGGPLPVGYSVEFDDGPRVLGTAVVSPTGHATLVLPRPYAHDRLAVTASLAPSHHYLSRPSNAVSVRVLTPQTTRLPGGLRVAKVLQGSGRRAVEGQRVGIDYNAYLTDGTPVDEGTQSFTLGTGGVGGVLEGVDQGVVGMKVGETRVFFIPPALGYGSRRQLLIPRNSRLVYVVTLASIG